MGVGRLIVIGVVVWLVLRWWQRRRSETTSVPRAHEGGRMVSCETCGVFVPEVEASRTSRNSWRCGQHRQAGGG